MCDDFIAAGLNTEAAGCYEKLIPLAPDNDLYRTNYGMVLALINRPKKAVAVLEETIRLFPPHTETYSNLGVALLNLSRHKEAIAAFNRALELAPENTAARYNLALTQFADKNKSAALEQYSFLKNSNAELAQKLYEIIFSKNVISVGDKK